MPQQFELSQRLDDAEIERRAAYTSTGKSQPGELTRLVTIALHPGYSVLLVGDDAAKSSRRV